MWAVLGAERREIFVAKLMHGAAAQIRLAASLRDMWQYNLDRFLPELIFFKRRAEEKNGGGAEGGSPPGERGEAEPTTSFALPAWAAVFLASAAERGGVASPGRGGKRSMGLDLAFALWAAVCWH